MATIGTQVYRYGGALFIIDELVSESEVAIRVDDVANGTTYYVHPSRWGEIVAAYPHIPGKLEATPRIMAQMAHSRLLQLSALLHYRQLTADDLAAAVAQKEHA